MIKDDYLKKTFSTNLKRMLYIRDKSQMDLVRDLNLPRSTVSEWTTGKKCPRMDKIQILANYFNCQMTDLIGTESEFATQILNKRTTNLEERIMSLITEVDLRDADFYFGGLKLNELELELFKSLAVSFADDYKSIIKLYRRTGVKNED